MGWDSSYDWNSKADVVAEILRTHSLRGEGNVVLALKSVRSGLWTLVETPKGVVIDFAAIERKDGRYWVKAMSEREHPFFYDVPVAWLERAPVQSREWRDKVLRIANRPKKPTRDMRVKLDGEVYICIDPLYKTAGMWKRERDGRRFRLSRPQFRERCEILSQ